MHSVVLYIRFGCLILCLLNWKSIAFIRMLDTSIFKLLSNNGWIFVCAFCTICCAFLSNYFSFHKSTWTGQYESSRDPPKGLRSSDVCTPEVLVKVFALIHEFFICIFSLYIVLLTMTLIKKLRSFYRCHMIVITQRRASLPVFKLYSV